MPLAQDFLDSKAKERMAELEDRVRRPSNLVIFRLPESELANLVRWCFEPVNHKGLY